MKQLTNPKLTQRKSQALLLSTFLTGNEKMMNLHDFDNDVFYPRKPNPQTNTHMRSSATHTFIQSLI